VLGGAVPAPRAPAGPSQRLARSIFQEVLSAAIATDQALPGGPGAGRRRRISPVQV